MRRLLAIFAIAVVVIISSCSSADLTYPRGQYGTTFGVITSVAPNEGVLFQIMSDNAGLFNVLRYDTPSYGVSKGARVYFDYEVIDEDASITEVRVRSFHYLVTKPVEFISDTAVWGNDPIRCAASFGGDHINLNYEYIATSSSFYHNIILVYDDLTPDDGYADFYLKHNADGDTGDLKNGSSVKGIASFRIAQFIPEGETQLNVRLHWTWWDANGEVVELSATKVFVPFG